MTGARRTGRGALAVRGLLGLLAGLCLLAACAPSKPPPAIQDGAGQRAAAPAARPTDSTPRRLVVAYSVDLTGGLDPFAHSGSTEYPRWLHVFDPLVRYDPQANTWVPHLAESWSTPSPTTIVFKLRDGVRFHDGSPLTADDVVFSLTRRRDDPDSKQASALGIVQAVEALDPLTVRVTTKEPDAAFLSRLDNGAILSKAQYDRLGRDGALKQPNGTGPYLFKEYVPGERLVLTRNPSYWGPFQSAWDEVVFRIIPEDEARITALLNGEVDLIANLPYQSIERVNGSGRARAVGVRGSRLMFVALNPITEPIKSPLVRRAIAHAIDKDALIEGILQGHAYRLDGPLGPGMYGYVPDLGPRYEYDLAKSRQLLAEAGYANGFDTDFYTTVNRFPKDREISAAIVQMLNQVGIRAKLQTPDFGTYFQQFSRGEYATYYVGRGAVVDPSEYFQQYFRTGVTRRLQYSNPEVDRLLAAQAAELVPDKRLALLKDAQARIMDEAPAVFLFQYEDTYGVGSRFDFAPRTDEQIFAWDVKPRS
jgi:peptide/nickel transport system substrate-binding protein